MIIYERSHFCLTAACKHLDSDLLSLCVAYIRLTIKCICQIFQIFLEDYISYYLIFVFIETNQLLPDISFDGAY